VPAKPRDAGAREGTRGRGKSNVGFKVTSKKRTHFKKVEKWESVASAEAEHRYVNLGKVTGKKSRKVPWGIRGREGAVRRRNRDLEADQNIYHEKGGSQGEIVEKRERLRKVNSRSAGESNDKSPGLSVSPQEYPQFRKGGDPLKA